MHMPAWQRLYKFAKRGDAAGIWHETYLIQAGKYEAVNSVMPKFGLGSVMEHVPATGRFNAARERLAAEG
ncbi:MAG TPA: DUF4188 domain-containing protein [Anaerolineales bacterium]